MADSTTGKRPPSSSGPGNRSFSAAMRRRTQSRDCFASTRNDEPAISDLIAKHPSVQHPSLRHLSEVRHRRDIDVAMV
jgi:hypothetical protein